MNVRSMRKRLISAMLVLVMMVSTLLGTTYAWFTDSVKSEGNKIESGTLKIDLLHSVDGVWTSLRDEPNHKIFNYDNWEPGYTRVESLKIANVGSLALKYKLSMAIADGTAILGENGENLADVIDVYVIYGASTAQSFNDIKATWTYKGTLSDVMNNPADFVGGNLTPSENEQLLTVALHMSEEAGNEYQNLSVGDIYVNLIATQLGAESDSFGNDYDADVIFPITVGKLYSASAPVTADVNGNAASDVKLGNDGDTGSATIPTGAKLATGATTLTLDITAVADPEANFELLNGNVAFPLDVHIEGLSADNTVPVTITLNNIFPKNLDGYNVTIYHVENGVTAQMILVDSIAALANHNEFYYDSTTGSVTLSMATFSEVTTTVAVSNPWNGTYDTSWYNVDSTEFVLETSAQFAGFAQIVGGMATGIEQDTFKGKTVTLGADINLGSSIGKIFYPVGYQNSTFSYEHISGGSVISNVYSFEGTFDGNGHTISDIYQNTWEMFGDYNDGYSGTPNYYRDGMGIFGFVYNGTVKDLVVNNFQSDGEFCTTGVVAAYSAGNSKFENIRITNCNPRAYNVPNGGVVGYAYDEAESEGGNSITFNNIEVDHTTKITALWGSWDVGCGGILGRLGDTTKLLMKNCTVGAIMDVYNDVCANYQYYDFRYAGILIGTVGSDGDTTDQQANMTFEDCEVYYGDWSNDYHYYCELVENSIASYTHDYQFSRLTKVGSVNELKNLEGEWNRTGNFVVVDGDDVTCYHVRVDNNGKYYLHDHNNSGTEIIDGETVLVEDKQRVHIPFKQLYTGYGWGASSVAGNTAVKEAKYTITYIYEGSVLDVVYVTDNTVVVKTANAELEKFVTDSTENDYVFDAWVNAGGVEVDEIAAGNTTNITLYVTWKSYHVARFVDQFGNVIYEASFKKGDNSIVGVPAVPEIPYCTGTWEDYSEKLNKATSDIVIYPVYTIDSSMLIATPVDENDDGIIDYYKIGSVGLIGTGGEVIIPGYINGIPVKVVTSLSATIQGSVTKIEVQEGVEELSSRSFAGTPDLTEVWLPSTIKKLGSNTFSIQGNDKKDELTIHFDGTKAQWDAIAKESNWAKGMRNGSMIICTDYTGEFKNNGSITWTKISTNN